MNKLTITEELLGDTDYHNPIKTDKWLRDRRFVLDTNYVLDFPTSVKVVSASLHHSSSGDFKDCLYYDAQTDKALKSVRKAEKSLIFHVGVPYYESEYYMDVLIARSDKFTIMFDAKFEIFFKLFGKQRLWRRDKKHQGLIVEDSNGKIIAVVMGFVDYK